MRRVNRINYTNKKEYVYHYIALFFIYSFVGFILEYLFRNVFAGRREIVGFLSFMPVLPIYGLMGMITYLLARPIENTIEKYSKQTNVTLVSTIVYVIFFTIVPAILELIGGFTLKNIFKTEQWDYSDKPLNYKGYISVINLVVFSVIGTLNMFYIFYKLDNLIVKYNKYRLTRIILNALVILLIADIVYTLLIYLDIF